MRTFAPHQAAPTSLDILDVVLVAMVDQVLYSSDFLANSPFLSRPSKETYAKAVTLVSPTPNAQNSDNQEAVFTLPRSVDAIEALYVSFTMPGLIAGSIASEDTGHKSGFSIGDGAAATVFTNTSGLPAVAALTEPSSVPVYKWYADFLACKDVVLTQSGSQVGSKLQGYDMLILNAFYTNALSASPFSDPACTSFARQAASALPHEVMVRIPWFYSTPGQGYSITPGISYLTTWEVRASLSSVADVAVLLGAGNGGGAVMGTSANFKDLVIVADALLVGTAHREVIQAQQFDQQTSIIFASSAGSFSNVDTEFTELPTAAGRLSGSVANVIVTGWTQKSGTDGRKSVDGYGQPAIQAARLVAGGSNGSPSTVAKSLASPHSKIIGGSKAAQVAAGSISLYQDLKAGKIADQGVAYQPNAHFQGTGDAVSVHAVLHNAQRQRQSSATAWHAFSGGSGLSA